MESMVIVTAAGAAYQPQSAPVFTKSTVNKVAQKTGIETPVALYRVGFPKRAVPRYRSNRRNVDTFVDVAA